MQILQERKIKLNLKLRWLQIQNYLLKCKILLNLLFNKKNSIDVLEEAPFTAVLQFIAQQVTNKF